MNKKTGIILVLAILGCFTQVSAQNYTFEGSMSDWTAQKGTLSLSSEHYKQGLQSLCWTTTGESQLIVAGFASFNTSTANSAYMQLYVPEANNDVLMVEFMSGTTVRRTANFLCNTRGWREFNRAYKDYASTTNGSVNALRITLKPTDNSERKIYFDDVRLNQTTESGHIPGTQWLLDKQYVTSNNTPLTLYAKQSDIPATTPTAEELSSLQKLRNTATQSLKPEYDSQQFIAARNYVNKMNLVRNTDGTIQGRIVDTRASVLSTDSITDILVRLRALAGAAENNILNARNFFDDYLDHVLDQGFAEGCNIIFASNSYSAPRSIIPLLLSILPTCNNTQRDQVVKLARWISFYGIINEAEENYLANINSDEIYLFITYIQQIALFHTNDAVAVRELKAVKRYLERSTEFVPGEKDMLKTDGTGFHHNTHYNNYMYAYQTLLSAISTFKGTEFRISVDAYERFKKAVLAIYTMATLHTNDTRHTANSLSGRNPFDSGVNVPIRRTEFQELIKIGGDYYGTSIDEDLAGAYNYFFKANTYAVPENSYEGFHQFNYSPAGIFRKGNWVATMRAPTTKLWGAEIYSRENRFGRYQSHGSLEITYGGGTLAESGYPTNRTGGGWDWNVIPGTTTVHYTSWQEMMPGKTVTARFDQYTKSTNFAGALSAGDCGIFVSNFDQGDTWGSQRFTPTNLVFKKSMFAFDNIIISLGSNIASSGEYGNDMITATNLFQNVISGTKNSIVVNGTTRTNPYNETLTTASGNWLITPQGTGYIIPKANDAIEVKFDAQKTPVETGADYANPATSLTVAKAYLNHGVKPSNKQYCFVVAPDTNPTEMQSLATRIGDNGGDLFKIENLTSSLHAVSYPPDNTMAYSFFEPVSDLNFGIVKATTSQHLLMVKKDSEVERYYFSICNPNLNPQGNATYGWIATPTQTILTLKGEWKAQSNAEGVSFAAPSNNETQVTITMKEGEAIHFGITTLDDTGIEQEILDEQPHLSYKNGMLQLIFPKPAEGDTNISIYTPNGIVVYQGEIQSGESTATIPVAQLSQGIYLCIVQDSRTVKAFKWVKND